MADKSINQLPVSDGLTDDGLLVVYQNSETKSIKGKLIRQFAEQGIEAALAEAKASGEFDGKDGEDGQDGYTPVKGKDYTDGEDGKDGVSPTITVTNITGGHRLTITDATGTKTVDVMDGEDGEGAGDMKASVYDPQGKAQDVFAYVDNAVKNAVSTDDIDAAVSEALEEAKASGEFDGKDGQDGQDGADGYSPVWGVDYWTDEDRQSIIYDILAYYPDAEMESF